MKKIATLGPQDTQAIITLKAHKKELTYQQYHTLRGQIFSGNTEGAMKGLQRLLNRRRKQT